ncbi:hypothetical protein BpHYR1_002405 [Brachionus plicatilis]|uniref:Uncharacterized protein n=1 Tax=Brachionus plicatilis TaxID=10195 RepID=A0A3M7PLV2_BRAPC|nr:hypothetical protein BpHYR1_002405 [Brachionus plicatilis]
MRHYKRKFNINPSYKLFFNVKHKLNDCISTEFSFFNPAVVSSSFREKSKSDFELLIEDLVFIDLVFIFDGRDGMFNRDKLYGLNSRLVHKLIKEIKGQNIVLTRIRRFCAHYFDYSKKHNRLKYIKIQCCYDTINSPYFNKKK